MIKKADYYKLVTTQVSSPSDLNTTNETNLREELEGEQEEVIYKNKKISAGKIETAVSAKLRFIFNTFLANCYLFLS